MRLHGVDGVVSQYLVVVRAEEVQRGRGVEGECRRRSVVEVVYDLDAFRNDFCERSFDGGARGLQEGMQRALLGLPVRGNVHAGGIHAILAGQQHAVHVERVARDEAFLVGVRWRAVAFEARFHHVDGGLHGVAREVDGHGVDGASGLFGVVVDAYGHAVHAR